jgi:hypothetical protein
MESVTNFYTFLQIFTKWEFGVLYFCDIQNSKTMSQVIDINPNKQTNRDGVWGLRLLALLLVLLL